MPRAGLTRDRVVDEAVTLVDDADLSLAVLADRLGVRVPSLYKHVEGLDDVTRAAATRCVRELTAVMRDAAVGVEWLPSGRRIGVGSAHAGYCALIGSVGEALRGCGERSVLGGRRDEW